MTTSWIWRAMALLLWMQLLSGVSMGMTPQDMPESGLLVNRLKIMQKHCRGTLHSWCGEYDLQDWQNSKPALHGSKECVGGCSGVGNCNYDTGLCDCPAGWQGANCEQPQLRPCTNRFGSGQGEAVGHIDGDGRDLDLTAEWYTESRCGGICDPVTSRCFCDGNHKRINPPPGSPPGTPAPKRGRPLGNHACQPSDNGKGVALPWGQVPWEQLYGPKGWCMSDDPVISCECMYDGFAGPLCEEVTEMWCPNQCSGHGDCDMGFCKCHAGYYGTDCARLKAGRTPDPGLQYLAQHAWLKDTVRLPSALLEASSSSSAGSGGRSMLTASSDEPLLGSNGGGDAGRSRNSSSRSSSSSSGGRSMLAASGDEPSLGSNMYTSDDEGSSSSSSLGNSSNSSRTSSKTSNSSSSSSSSGGVADGSQDAGGSGSEDEGSSGAKYGTSSTSRMIQAASVSSNGVLLPMRKRPFIYVYDLPPVFNARMAQYRVDKTLCVWRGFESGNHSQMLGWPYGIETLLHELMLQSSHRTFDPEEADFFYVPTYTSCYIFPLHSFADFPWFHAPSGPRVMHATNIMLDALTWIKQHLPYWQRRQGRDHIWLMSHDEGACYAPNEIYATSIMLTQWGRTDLNHTSNTAYTPDNYTQEYEHPLQPGGWLRLIQGHPCFSPNKDLVIPNLKLPHNYAASPLMGAPQPVRDMLAFFRGDMGQHRLPFYSRGIRQRLYNMSKEFEWRTKHNIFIGTTSDTEGDYSKLLTRSTFCLVLPGDGYSPRAEDAILHGCIPVIIMDEVQAVFESILDYSSFSLRLKESQLANLPHLLLSVPQHGIKVMQQNLRKVWHRFAYMQHPLIAQAATRNMAKHGAGLVSVGVPSDAGRLGGSSIATGGAEGGSSLLKELLGPAASAIQGGRKGQYVGFPVEHDAFGTLIQWLYHRINATR